MFQRRCFWLTLKPGKSHRSFPKPGCPEPAMGDLLPQYLWSGLKSSFAECADLSALGKRRQSPHSRLRLPDDRVTAPISIVNIALQQRAHLFAHQFKRKSLTQQMVEKLLGFGAVLWFSPEPNPLFDRPIDHLRFRRGS